MTREEFNSLAVEKQINLVNSYLKLGKSMIDIFKRERLIEADESSVRKRFIRNGYKHNKDINQYELANSNTRVSQEYTTDQNQYTRDMVVNKAIKTTEYPQSIKEIIPKEVEKKEAPQSNTLGILQEKKETLLKLVDQQPELEELVNWWRKEKNIIELPQLTLDKAELTGEIMGKTFKTYKNVVNKFLEFCNKHNEYTQRDLVAMALLEYIEKYN